jgi:L,D-transpeptidase catalytic domain
MKVPETVALSHLRRYDARWHVDPTTATLDRRGMVRGRVMRRLVALAVLGSLVPLRADARVRRCAARLPVPSAVPRVPLPWPRADILDLALKAYDCARSGGLVEGDALTIIDYSLPSTARRLWVIDVPARRVVFNELVAHGAASGENYAAAFSNEPGSRQSSLGLFRTEDTYAGQHGESLRLSGLEPGINDRAMERAIVIHGAPYVSPTFIAARGELGRSWGCPALEHGVERRVIERIKGGTAFFVYYPDPHWLHTSRFLRCDERTGT